MSLSTHGLKRLKFLYHFKTKIECPFRPKDLKQKSNVPFHPWIYFVYSIFNSIFLLKIDFYANFQFNLTSDYLMRFCVLKNKSIMGIQLLR